MAGKQTVTFTLDDFDRIWHEAYWLGHAHGQSEEGGKRDRETARINTRRFATDYAVKPPALAAVEASNG